VRAHIADFGGDPDRIAIFGQSAGAGSVRAMMASPKAVGKFADAIPFIQPRRYQLRQTYSLYYTTSQEVTVAANAILVATNCTNAPSQVDCLRAVPASTLAHLSTVARYLVVDGTYLTSHQLRLSGSQAPYNPLMGTMRDDGAAFINYPITTNEFDPFLLQRLLRPPSGNGTYDLYNISSRLVTDGIFRCVDEATVNKGLDTGLFPKVYYYEFDRSYQTRGWPGTSVCDPPKAAIHPSGDPSLPHFRCHSGELYYVFGNLAWHELPMRDEKDLPFEQFVLDSFARTGDPNPDKGFLRARGYGNTLGGDGEGGMVGVSY
jgi:carboxylesterase type B